MNEGGSGDGASLSEEDPWRGPWGGGAPSLGTLEDMLRKAPATGTSLHVGPFPSEVILVCEGKLVYRGLWKMDEGRL
jgi:hypothetical protein